MEQRKHYTIYFSGNEKLTNDKGEILKNTHAGVGIIISNELRNYIEDIEPINDGIISLTIGSKTKTHHNHLNIRLYGNRHRRRKKRYYKQLKDTQLRHQNRAQRLAYLER